MWLCDRGKLVVWGRGKLTEGYQIKLTSVVIFLATLVLLKSVTPPASSVSAACILIGIRHFVVDIVADKSWQDLFYFMVLARRYYLRV